MSVDHVSTELNPADLMTKVLKRQVFEKHRNAQDGIELCRECV